MIKKILPVGSIFYVFGAGDGNRTHAASLYHISSYGYGMFDSYKGQDVMLFDEFRSSIPIAQMLCYLYGYPLYLSARYNNKLAMFTKVYIISNISLAEQYPNVQKEEPKTYNAFLRQITTVYDFDKSKEIPITNTKLIPIDINLDDIF